MLMLNVWPFVIIAILVAPATPSLKQDSVDKRYSSAPKEIRSKFNARPQDVSKKSLKRGATFTQKLLYRPETQGILRETIESKFIQGMVKGTLTNEQYRGFLMQDAHYLSRGRDILRQTSTIITNKHPEFANMYNIQAGKYDTAYQNLLKELNMPNVDDVVLSPETVEYEQFLMQLSLDQPRRLAIGFLPCSQSFRFISGQLLEEANTHGSKYKQFFQSNYRQPGYESELERFVNGKVDEGVFTDGDIPIYLKGMQNEENFIKAAGSER